MATRSAPTADADTRSEAQPLWQAPVFVLGVAAFVAVCLLRPLGADPTTRQLERDLTLARQQLARSDGDLDAALQHAQKAVDGVAADSDRAGEAYFLLGSAHARLAERPPGRNSADSSQDHWVKARAALEQAEDKGVPEADSGRLTYRLAQAGFHTGEEMQKVVLRLASVQVPEHREEVHRLLSRAYQRLPRPDYEKALEANQKLRDLHGLGEAQLAEAMLEGGELLRKMGRVEDARKTLERIRETTAPPAVLARSRLLRARTYQEQSKWVEAVNLYVLARADAQRAPLPDEARVDYDLGLCYARIEQPDEAARVWERCLRKSKGPEAAAAALALCQLLLNRGQAGLQGEGSKAEEVIARLEEAVRRIARPEDWKNPLVELAQARQTYEAACTALPRAGRHDLAVRAARLYERLAPPGRALVLRAELSADWARSRQERAAQVGDREVLANEEKAARELFKQSAEAYAEAANRPGVSEGDRLEYLWQGAAQSMASKDHAMAVESLNRFLQLEKSQERLGQAQYILGEAYRAMGNNQEASNAYTRCRGIPTRYQWHALYRLAEFARSAGELDKAETILTESLGSSRFTQDPEMEEKILYTLGGLLYQRNKYLEAERRLDTAVHKFKSNPRAMVARYQLADSYRQIASQENQRFLLDEGRSREAREHYQAEHRRRLKQAAEEFTELTRQIEAAKGKDPLTREQRVRVPLAAARCWFDLGQYENALAIYESQIAPHRGKIEGLDALGGTIKCHEALAQRATDQKDQRRAAAELDRIRQRLLEIRRVLPEMEDTVRRPWEQWVEQASAQLGGL